MAGFRARAHEPIDLRVVPYPAVTVAVDFGNDALVLDATGRRQRGSVVLGLAPDDLTARGRDIECLQVRLSPVVAHAVLGGAAPETSAMRIHMRRIRNADHVLRRPDVAEIPSGTFEMNTAIR